MTDFPYQSLRNRYHLMRHGESTANIANLIISLPENGLNKHGLSALGRQQATQTASAAGLSSRTLIVASDFKRASETALLTSAAIGGKWVRFEPLLRERFFGELEGQSGDQYRQVWAQDERTSESAPFGAEPSKNLVERLAKVLEKLESEYEDREILLVSHGDPLRFLQLWAAGRPLTDHLKIKLFQPAEIRGLNDLPVAQL